MRDSNLMKIENVAVSTRIRLARNVAGYPFPSGLKSERKAKEIVAVVEDALSRVEEVFKHYRLSDSSVESATYLKERHLISQALINNAAISAAFISKDERISVMVNEEDHIREQYFFKGFDLATPYERLSVMDDIISRSVSFAFDKKLGFLTACPTNLGTGLRASVMLFLPALTRRKRMPRIASALRKQGLTVRGAFGEGSANEGDMYQISNEVTLGWSEEEIISVVEERVIEVVGMELHEREEMQRENDISVIDGIFRAYGLLTNCMRLTEKEFMRCMAEVKLGVALGYFEGELEELDNLISDLRPANISRLSGATLTPEQTDVYRAKRTGQDLRDMELFTEEKRHDLFGRRQA